MCAHAVIGIDVVVEHREQSVAQAGAVVFHRVVARVAQDEVVVSVVVTDVKQVHLQLAVAVHPTRQQAEAVLVVLVHRVALHAHGLGVLNLACVVEEGHVHRNFGAVVHAVDAGASREVFFQARNADHIQGAFQLEQEWRCCGGGVQKQRVKRPGLDCGVALHLKRYGIQR